MKKQSNTLRIIRLATLALSFAACPFFTGTSFAGTLYVSQASPQDGPGTNWPTAFHTIQSAINGAGSGDLVLVTNGTYNAGATEINSMSNRVALTKAISVESVNGPEYTLIEGAGPSGTNAVRCVYINAGELAGFTLTHGHTQASGNSPQRSGGGVWFDSGGTVSNCIICGNTNIFEGGGAYCNEGGTLINCTVRNNAANYGGGVYCKNNGTLINCILAANTAEHQGGGAVCGQGGTFNNCTISGNSTDELGGGLYCFNEGTLNNCILWGNIGSNEGNWERYGTSMSFSHCCTTPSFGTGCITNDPLFVSSSDTHLQFLSPCINAGTNMPWMDGATDREGNPRIFNEQVDIGALEFPEIVVTTLPATDLLNDMATFNGTVNPNDTETSAWFEWGSTRNGDYSNRTESINVGGGTTNVAIDLSDLPPGIHYHYRIVATNSLMEACGQEQTFWTPAIDFRAPAFLTLEQGSNFVDLTTIHTTPLAIAAGVYHSLALRVDGSVVGWGDNSYTNIPAGATNVVAIAAGGSHSLALRADGSVVGWGDNFYGQTNIPASVTNVVAIAAGGSHSLALRADGSVVGWGWNYHDQTTIPSSVYNFLPLTTNGVVDTAVLGTYVLTYSTTNSLGAVGTASRTVVVATLPTVTTEPATGIGVSRATLQGSANPRASETQAWFEYGLGASYGQETPTVPLDITTNAQSFSTFKEELLPWMTYHYRAVATNGLGRTDGSDRTFTLLPPSFGAPSLSAPDDLSLPQGGGTSVWFTAAPAGVDVRVACNNPILLPENSLVLAGSSLGITPDPTHSGSAQITLTASDGMQSASQTFTLTVVPVDPSQLLNLEAQPVSGEAWRLKMYDDGTASTNYVVEYRPDLSPTSTWTAAANVLDLGGGEYELDLAAAQGDAGFYRIKGFRMLQGGFASTEFETEEGRTVAGVVVVFNSIFSGELAYSWTDELGSNYTDTVPVNGTTVVIPLPEAILSDDAGVGLLEHLTLQLDAGTGYVRSGNTASRVTIEENDADWQGVIETECGMLGFTLAMLQDNGTFNGRIQSDGFGFFPTNILVQLLFSDNAFTAVAKNIPLAVYTDDPMGYLDLRLDAANSSGETNVSSGSIEGEATLVVKVPGLSHLDAAQTVPFVLDRPPTAASTNEISLYSTSEGE
ncbi:choice-of-anchor Q domain-containing protein [Pontiella sulfatireligans]|uniref:Fibronectin type-III domain-containing protein n=1 Tax=Pontiella sulfatireligans TaxID=2750658 RepID=A0A6C2UR13_9BACT|nr:choice-of-anchor Q domain-containing protein [Pontiella sulfatireligans]VGO21701.1 hypothetical protein SCARR_03775 [Pontiella sulfatireligans]